MLGGKKRCRARIRPGCPREDRVGRYVGDSKSWVRAPLARYIDIRIYIKMRLCVYKCIYIQMYMHMYLYIYMFVCMHVHMYVYVYIYVHISILMLLCACMNIEV